MRRKACERRVEGRDRGRRSHRATTQPAARRAFAGPSCGERVRTRASIFVSSLLCRMVYSVARASSSGGRESLRPKNREVAFFTCSEISMHLPSTV